MTPDALARLAIAKPGAWVDEPWEGDQVVKVGPPEDGKIFAFLGSTAVGLKCGAHREEADEWLARFPGDASVMAYIGRFGWNNLKLAGAIPDDEIADALDRSYVLVVAALPKRLQPSGWDRAAPITGPGT